MIDEYGRGGVTMKDDDSPPSWTPPLSIFDVEGKMHRGCASPDIPTLIDDEPSSIMMGDVCLLLDVVVTWNSLDDEILNRPLVLPIDETLESADVDGSIVVEVILFVSVQK